MNDNFADILNFWFEELELKNWFEKSEQTDQQIKSKFLPTLERTAKNENYLWRKTIKGRLAEIIVLDQFPRNIFRGQKESFAYDNMALALSLEAISQEEHNTLNPQEIAFLMMPLMHSESQKIHRLAAQLFNRPKLENQLEYELKHKIIIDRFGRYPHRNKILNRPSTPEELEFLKQPNSSF